MIFGCYKCQKKFTIEEDNIVKKETVTCPNCESKVSPELLDSLKSLCNKRPNIIQGELGEMMDDKNWRIKLEIDCK